MILNIRKTSVYETVELDPLDVCTVKEASEIIGVTMSTVNGYMARGKVTVLEDPSAGAHNGKRLLLRNEVEQLARREKSEVSVTEAAQLLGVTKSRVSQLVAAGKITLTQEGIRQHLSYQKAEREPILP